MIEAGSTIGRLSVARIQLTNFRGYQTLTLEAGPEPQVLAGSNGAGKTNLLEAISLLVPGQGLRGALTRDFARAVQALGRARELA